jgi:hypothetical protein
MRLSSAPRVGIVGIYHLSREADAREHDESGGDEPRTYGTESDLLLREALTSGVKL